MDQLSLGPLDPPPLCSACSGPWSWARVGQLAKLFGPAAMVASVSIGAGETIVVVRAGAWFGYDLLWLILLAVLAKGVCVTYLLGRYTAISGEPINQRLVRMPGPRGWLPLSVVALEMAAVGPLWAAIARPSGELLAHLLVPAATNVSQAALAQGSLASPGEHWGTWLGMAFVALAVLSSFWLSYESLERQQVVICGLLVLGTIIGVWMVQPDLAAAMRGMASIGSLPEFPSWAPVAARQSPALMFATTFGYVGGTVLGYMVYANWIGLRGWGMTGHPEHRLLVQRAALGHPRDYLPRDAERVRAIRASIAPLKWDVGGGALVLLMVTASFMTAGAAVLYPLLASGKLTGAFEGWRLLTDQASLWSNVHPHLVWVYYVCVILGLWGTLQAFPEIYTRVIVDVFQAIWPNRTWNYRGVQSVVALYILTTSGAALAWGPSFDLLTQVVAFLTTNLAVAFAMGAALYLNFELPSAYRTRWWMLAAGIASVVGLGFVSWVSGVGLWRQLS